MGKAVFVTRHGGPEVLELRDHDLRAPGAGQVRIRVEAAGVNFIDIYQRSGAYPRPTPFIAGAEGAGVVEAVGEGVRGVASGCASHGRKRPGSYATHVNAPAAVLVRVPDGVDSPSAAACMLQGMTAHYLVHGVRQTGASDTVLVHAAAGGTGQLLVQMLKRAGARVIGTCSSEAKEQLARAAGADEVIRYTERDFVAEVKRLTGGARRRRRL